MMKRVLFITSGLQAGGAEKVLYSLLLELAKKNYHVCVISLTPGGKYKPLLIASNISVHEIVYPAICLHQTINGIVKVLEQFKPETIQTWMYHADFIGSLAAIIYNKAPVFWGLRNSTLSLINSSASVLLARAFCIPLSYFVPQKIISCSLEGIKHHKRIGYKKSKFAYVPNGINVEKNAVTILSDDEKKWDVIFVGRYDRQKNIPFFLNVMQKLVLNLPSLSVVMLGSGMDTNNKYLMQLIKERNLIKYVECYGQVSNISDFYKRSKTLVSVSRYGEAFPNIALEAMYYGTIPIFFDVGDARFIIADEDLVVSKKISATMLANKVMGLVSMNSTASIQKKLKLRYRASSEFYLEKMIDSYIKIYETN